MATFVLSDNQYTDKQEATSPRTSNNYFQIPQVNIERSKSDKKKSSNTKLSPSKLYSKSPVSPTAKFPFKNLPTSVESIANDDIEEYFKKETPIVFDIRPFNLYSQSRLSNSINLCMPTTLLKRPAYDLVQLLNLINISVNDKQIIHHQIHTVTTEPISILVYDSESYTNHITFALYQTIFKFLKYNSNEETKFKVGYINGGFNSIENKSIIDSSELNPSNNLNIASPPSSTFSLSSSISSYSPISPLASTSHSNDHIDDHAPYLGGFTLPSSAPSQQKFLSSIKKNNLILPKLDMKTIQSNEELIDDDINHYNYQIKLPKNLKDHKDELPNWLKFLAEDIDDVNHNEILLKKFNLKFNKIETCEQIRLNAAITRNSDHAACSNPNICSPSSLCPGCDDINYKIPKGIEYGFKNRYNNIWPYEHSRVKLINLPSIQKIYNNDNDDYFNANYIHFPKLSNNRYIATQNPLQSTFEDFWKIIWYNKIPLIICLNNQSLMLNQKYFDDQFFPTSQLKVEVISTKNQSNYIHREIKLSKLNYNHDNTQIINHFEYKDWPDFGVPKTFDSILNLINDKSNLITSKNLKKDLLIHCSAGCGRTGCFITLDMILDLMKSPSNSKFDFWGNDDLIYKAIQFQRTQRISMVQNLDQFIVCYEIIIEYIVDNLLKK